MEDMVLELKKKMIEVLNLEDMRPDDIDDDAPLFGEDSDSTASTPWNSSS